MRLRIDLLELSISVSSPTSCFESAVNASPGTGVGAERAIAYSLSETPVGLELSPDVLAPQLV